jgi:hypothetical protein
MIDLDLLTDTARWNQHCEQLQKHNIPLIQTVWNGSLDIDFDSLDLSTQSHYEDRHGTGVLAEQEVSPETAVLDRTVIDSSHPAHIQIRQVCGLSEARVAVNLQKPGNFIPSHIDKNRTFVKSIADRTPTLDWSDIQRFFYFFDDQEPGQFVQLGDTQIQWRAGDMVQWSYYLRHATANASYQPRKMLTIIGVR